MIDQSKLEGRVIAAALRLATEKPWRDVTLRDIAEAAGSSLVELRAARIGSKSQVLIAFNKAVDAEVLGKAPKSSPGQPPRDLLFEVMMSRFDALQPHKAAIRSILRSADADAGLMRSLLNSQYWMLQAAGLGAEGLEGQLRLAGLASIYSSVLQVWLDDEDPGLARTMAALDRRLRSGERTMQSVESICGGLRRMADTFGDLGRGMRDRARSSQQPEPDGGMPPAAGSSAPSPGL